MRTLFSQEMINNGVLMPYIAISKSHTYNELEITLHAIKNALNIYSSALNKGAEHYLKSEIIKPVFRKFN